MYTQFPARRLAAIGIASALLATVTSVPAGAEHGYRMTQQSSQAYFDALRADAAMSDMSERMIYRGSDELMRHPLRGDFPKAGAESASAGKSSANVHRGPEARHPLRGDFPYASGSPSPTE